MTSARSGRAVEARYHAMGFVRKNARASPLLRGGNIPGDHLGFMLSFAGWFLLGLGARKIPADRAPMLDIFVRAHLDGWVDEFCKLLASGDEDGYLSAVAQAAAAVRMVAAPMRKS